MADPGDEEAEEGGEPDEGKADYAAEREGDTGGGDADINGCDGDDGRGCEEPGKEDAA